jgi:hypothetical protein
MAELADVFRRHGVEYLERFGERVLPSHRHALQDIADCRTEALGGHLAQCSHCAHLRYSYHSCRNRGCPKCHRTDTERWLNRRRKDLLPVTYFHVVFTLPKELRHFVRAHQKVLFGVLFLAAARSLMKLAADEKYVGGQIGLLCVLHTWTRAMVWHPHIHCLVPSIGLSQDGQYRLPSGKNYLVPVVALSRIFRAKFMSLASKALPDVTFPESVWKTDWVVYSKHAAQGADKVLTYLARYVYRIAITNNRILSFENGDVTFRYKDSQEHRWRTMTLPSLEFMRRFLQHVLPDGFHKVRHYGLLHPANREKLKRLQEGLKPPIESQIDNAEITETAGAFPHVASLLCPCCHTGYMVLVSILSPKRRAPP